MTGVRILVELIAKITLAKMAIAAVAIAASLALRITGSTQTSSRSFSQAAEKQAMGALVVAYLQGYAAVLPVATRAHKQKHRQGKQYAHLGKLAVFPWKTPVFMRTGRCEGTKACLGSGPAWQRAKRDSFF